MGAAAANDVAERDRRPSAVFADTASATARSAVISRRGVGSGASGGRAVMARLKGRQA
jgi:hypothetical protein